MVGPALLERAVEHGTLFMPGRVFLAGVADAGSLRQSISNHAPESIAEHISRLEAAIAMTPVGTT